MALRKPLTEENLRILVRELDRMPSFIIAVDGRCASGKTTLAARLSAQLDAQVLHMDDFFLRPEQRTPERYAEPGGNVDRERVYDVLKQVKSGDAGAFRRFDCDAMELADEKEIRSPRVIVEGAYSMHPLLREFYDLSVFLSIPYEKQLERLERRNPDRLQMFIDRWIPLEETYFRELKVEEACTYSFVTV